MPSFDVVSKTDLMEVDNAVNGVKRQIRQRFDLAGTKCDVERNENSLTITADDNMKLTQLHDLLRQNFASRKVDAKALDFGKAENASGDSLRQEVTIKQGIDQELARNINKAVKGFLSTQYSALRSVHVMSDTSYKTFEIENEKLKNYVVVVSI